MDKPYTFSEDVYKLSSEDFKVFVKSKFPKVSVKKIKELHKNGNTNTIPTEVSQTK